MPQNKLSPVVRGGLAAEQAVSTKTKNLLGYHVGKGTDDMHTEVGFYLGAGVDIMLSSHVLRLTAEYKWTHASFSGITSQYISLCAGIRL